MHEIPNGIRRKKSLVKLQAQATASFKGFLVHNEMAPFVAEFNNRKRMIALGYGDFMENLDAYTAECFIEISMLYNKLEIEKMNNDMGRR